MYLVEPYGTAVLGPQVQADPSATFSLDKPEFPRPVAPLTEGDKDRDKAPSFVGQDVVMVRAPVRGGNLCEDARSDQFLESCREDVLRDAQAPFELVEPTLAAERVPHDEDR